MRWLPGRRRRELGRAPLGYGSDGTIHLRYRDRRRPASARCHRARGRRGDSGASQSRYRTALLQMQSPLLDRPTLINPLIRAAIDGGLADLVDPEVPIAARLALAHHPGFFLHLPARVPQIQADCKLLIVNHPLLDAEGGSYFPAERIAWSVQEVLGPDVRTAPRGPQIRAQFEQAPWQLELHELDWPPTGTGPVYVQRTPLAAQPDHHRTPRPSDPSRGRRIGRTFWPRIPTAGIAVRVMGSAIELQRRFGDAIRTWSIVDPQASRREISSRRSTPTFASRPPARSSRCGSRSRKR